jgi:hypothetical protein
VTSSAVAWIAIAGAAFFLFTSEQQLASREATLRAFDLQARDAAEALAGARAGQQAYVAAGQGAAFWVPKVAALLDRATATVDALRTSAVSEPARQDLAQASVAITQLSNVDRRARDYIRDGEMLMAGDVVFAEGGDVAATALHQMEAARLAEWSAFDADETAKRRLEATVLAGTAGLSALILAILALARGPSADRVGSAAAAATPTGPSTAAGGQRITTDPRRTASLDVTDDTMDEVVRGATRESSPDTSRATTHEETPEPAHSLLAAASVCTGFGSARDAADLSRLLPDAAGLMEASGLIVWLGTADGGDLRPVLAYGYPEQTLARIPPVPRSADNAAAAAYRSGALQVVVARPGTSAGAVVAPILSADGCIGALTAEFRDRGETLEAVQALATIFAAQLAGVLAASAATVANNDNEDTVKIDRMVSA